MRQVYLLDELEVASGGCFGMYWSYVTDSDLTWIRNEIDLFFWKRIVM
jgi:hypothetical protein